MAKRLPNLIESPIDFVAGDQITFSFKNNIFSAYVSDKGLIYDTAWTAPGNTQRKIFDVRSFESLTDWTETCIQEKLQEYHTRYSAWRRVRQSRTRTPMEDLFKEFMRNNYKSKLKKLSPTDFEHFNDLNNQRILQLELQLQKKNKIVDEWSSWFEKYHTGEKMPVEREQNEQPPPTKMAVRPIVLNSPSGTYLVIQRCEQTKPSAIPVIQSLGIEGFRKLAEKFIKEHKTWHPPIQNKDDTWLQSIIHEVNTKPGDVATLVHDFFNTQ